MSATRLNVSDRYRRAVRRVELGNRQFKLYSPRGHLLSTNKWYRKWGKDNQT